MFPSHLTKPLPDVSPGGTISSWKKRLVTDGLADALGGDPPPDKAPRRRHGLAWFTEEFWRQASDSPLPLATCMKLARRGFLPQAATLYDLDRHGPAAYLPDLAAMVRGWSINDPHGTLLWDKKRFHRLLHERGHGRLCPLTYGLLGTGLEAGQVVSLLEDEGDLVVKARHGGRGERVHLLSKTPDGYSLDGEPRDRAWLEDRLGRLDGYLVSEYCTPASYARDLFPGTPNTVRILTLNPEDRSPFIAGSVHRVGTPRAAVDNFSQGGLSVNVRSDGTLGEAVASRGWRSNRHETHPDTGAPIQGATIPGWSSIRAQVLDVASSLPEVPYIGWDLIVTGPGEFQVIEANANPDVDLVQAHEPLLLDKAARAFYSEHGLV